MSSNSPQAKENESSDRNTRVNDDEQSVASQDPMIRDGVTTIVLSAYSVGHFANDLCASMWFIYLSYYLLNVVDLDPNTSGLCLLSGQIADGITTPIVGYFSDKLNPSCGKRNTWYYMGSLLVAPAFLCIFVGFDFFSSQGGKNAWYLIFPAVFNVGWAAVQISHMSIVNQLSYSQRQRDKMAVNRNGFTYAANIFVLSLALALFATISNQVTQFRILGLVCVGLGAVTTLFYISTIKEPSLSKMAIEREAAYKQALGQVEMKTKDGEAKKAGKTAGDWLKEAQFYIFGCVYMFARISLNTTATIMPLYLDVVSRFEPKDQEGTAIALAAVPLASYICSLIFSLTLQNWLTQRFRNRVIPMFISIIVTAIGSMPMAFLGSGDMRYAIYAAASIQGVGNAMMLNTGTACISDVIGQDNTSAAFVYGAYSLADKFANGILLYWLVAVYSEDANALQWIISVVPTASAIGCTLATWIGIKLYADKLAKISSGSMLNAKKREQAKARAAAANASQKETENVGLLDGHKDEA